MGTTLELPPGVFGITDGAFFPKSLFKPLFTAEGMRRKINDQWRAVMKSHERGTLFRDKLQKEKKKNHPVSLDCNCLITVITSYHEKEVHPPKTQQKQPIDLKVHLPSLTLETSKQNNSNRKQKSCQAKLLAMCDPAFWWEGWFTFHRIRAECEML